MTIRLNNASTVFFTPEEINRIRTTATTTLQQASQLRGTPRQPRDAASSIREATAASLVADMAVSSRSQGRGESLPVLTVGQPYPPCTTPTSDLAPMALAELRVGTHHRGRKLVLKRAAGVRGRGVSAVVQLAARSWALVQGVGGEGGVERLEVCLHTHQYGKDVLECSGGKTFVVREPYFTVTEQGEATIRVDHLSDLEWLDNEDESPGQMLKNGLESAETAVREARRCKERGNTALAARDPALACTHYTRGLSQLAQRQAKGSSDPNGVQMEALTRDLHRNRAHTDLLLNHLDAAKRDALSSLTGDPSASDPESSALNSKAYYRAGCAAYNLGGYDEARGFFSRRQQLTPEVGDAAVRTTYQRIGERDTGVYDWPKMRASAALSRLREVDAASFVGRTGVGDSPGRGRGLFATCDIPRGGLVLCEKAFCVAWGDGQASATAVTYDVRDGRIRVSPVGLVKAVVQKLRGTPSYIGRVMELYGDYRGSEDVLDHEEVHSEDGSPVVDVFRVHDIVSRNAFGLGPPPRNAGKPDTEVGGMGMSTGLWVRAARINHSCVPNTEKEFIGDMMLVRAKRAISAGEEILHSYIDEKGSYKARQEALMATWGFECGCGLCGRQKGR
ncbi:hypothetical protein INS49_010659 [Diaporthe citri]|uniref:uncharacterized protein n=1 Tax=Diaporthe citri TaxID=83186 RepID=UPI001C80A9DB|nr:uncharacterized protein INS49_010659 [Diaporthe citri]KAG6362429.1 hypothetical protein INS49_010659 [Diaporthe citri]